MIFVNGHGSNVKVAIGAAPAAHGDGAVIGYYKPYAERYMGMIRDVLEGPAEETPAGTPESRDEPVPLPQPGIVRMDRAVADRRTRRNGWDRTGKERRHARLRFQGYQYFQFPFDHEEFTDSGVMGNPFRGLQTRARSRSTASPTT